MALDGSAVLDSVPPSAPARSLTRPRRAPVTPHEQRDVTVHGLRLRYIDVAPKDGEHDAPLLLIHGHSSRLEEYDALVPHLAKRRRVLVPDLPGSGYSDKPGDARYSLALYEDSLLGFLDALGIDRCHVGGGSLGGNLVLRLGHREPERFAHLAAWAPAGSWDRLHGMAFGARILKSLPFLFWPSLWVQSRFWYSRDWAGRRAALENAWAYYTEVYGPGFHRMYWEIGIEQALTSLFDRAHRIHHPTYLAYGERDKALDMDRGVQRLAKMLPRAHLRMFRNARHSLANEIPEQLGGEVDGFLATGTLDESSRR
jgi:pimeloyl-ACP methyl ester carboxylesterase